jgi:hypothetical protein
MKQQQQQQQQNQRVIKEIPTNETIQQPTHSATYDREHMAMFWYFIAERHAIWERRNSGQAAPWTTDPLLRDFYFTNVYPFTSKIEILLEILFQHLIRLLQCCNRISNLIRILVST